VRKWGTRNQAASTMASDPKHPDEATAMDRGSHLVRGQARAGRTTPCQE